MLTIGHRGCAGQYPENTVRAIAAAAPHVDAVEIDVTRCGSGELVLFHDDDLQRVTGFEGRIDETPWERLAELDVDGSGEPIPRFGEALAAWPDGLLMNLDIHETGIAPEALAEVETSGFEEDIILSSTSEAVLREARDAPGSVARGLSFHEAPAANVRRAVDLGCQFVHVFYRRCLDTELVDIAHETGLRVDAWTVDDADDVSALREADVDAVTLDRWDIV